MSAVALILAAGQGTRMRSRRPKVLHPVCGRPMLAYVVEAATATTGAAPWVVVSPAMEADVREAVGPLVCLAVQPMLLGTGDALRVGLAQLSPTVEQVVVASGDTPLITAATLGRLLEARATAAAAMALATMEPDDPTGYGRVVRDGDGPLRIVEEKDATADERTLGEVVGGAYAFDAPWLRGALERLSPSSATGELYLTGLVALARADGRAVVAVDVEDDLELAGVNDRVQLATVEADLRWRILEAHMLAGVTMQDPTTVYVDAQVELAGDVVLEPNVILRGATVVGEGTVIGAGSQLIDSRVGAGCRVWASVLEGSEVDDGATVGPFAHLRPGSSVGQGAEVGNFAELKQARLGARSKQHHMSYLGDATLGEGVNVGAGTITANYDGRRKHRTTIGDGAFLGVDTMLVAPVTVGAAARTGAGAVVTHDVPPGKLAVGVPARIREPRLRPEDAGTP
ncbi:MAG TPA: bifunctional UDP-N-acetylglucosamine diphosphorylase/glucosamine-1-phosphate N-acetyltransferase GlmU [Candidatus Baltobacteraceae bacterium]|nr:bifunctional UDP-N-acetylglucosamine diphosphorylase/glucosamine-1-phosphate N-acetyltransferase GlmU [Candidatus Baltobacteraceae bacterium]